ncbi:hypothetical protein GCM10017714_33920 [Curtobacterium pusillum]|uniref:Uncharacterized protein n=1 Tax=Curtobacterium pusillum TaxID=69373 RepID=A0ABX2MAW8_9MICO|nr:hypothetical protein [Curtobacterium pusillum]NUU15100.1 hypothetical protein [Curtobacterium pusillum]GLK31574.1 hypothetical protein GCM10017610_18590 [Curtobacterium pusillum]
MDKYDRRRLRAPAFKKHLRDQLSDEPVPTSPAHGAPLSEFSPNLDTPAGAYLGAPEAKWAEASRGRAGTGSPIAQLNGAAKTSATRAHIAGGSIANGGPGQAGAEPALFKVGMASTGLSLAGCGVVIGCEVARTIGPHFLTALRLANPDVRDTELEERGGSKGQAAAVLTMSGPTVVELPSEEQAADTIIMPVVGDDVHYSRGSGYLIGLQGVVVASDDGQALPSGLRYVQFDGEEWPKVVAVTGLDRI